MPKQTLSDLTFSQFLEGSPHRRTPELQRQYRSLDLLALDPGHTTGWAFFSGEELVDCGEIDTRELTDATHNLIDLFNAFRPTHIVLEDYRVYKWRQKHHVGSELTTTRVIGCIETVAALDPLTPGITKQPANVAKGFCTNKRLQQWGFYSTGQKHANDAIRHGCYFLLFGALQAKDRKSSSHSVG